MRPSIIKKFLFLLVFFLCTSAFGGTSKNHNALVKEYIELAGLQDVFKNFPEQIKAQARQQQLTSKHPKQDKRITEIILQTFDDRKALDMAAAFYLKNSDEAFLQSVIRQYRTPLFEKVLAEERKSSGPGAEAEMLRFLADLQSNPPSEFRIAIIQKFEGTLGLTDMATEIAMAVIHGMTLSFNLADSDEDSVPEEELLEKLNNLRPMLQQSLRQQIILSCYYTYRNISNEELAAYADFYNTELGQKERALTSTAISYVLGNIFAEVGERIIEEAKKEKEEKTPLHQPT